ncbi:MAG: aldehyde ferredoxin oxidoreductase C-terminal domain-containing protein [Deltaproteobacteria bacterium]|nr:aldehyde ferredoxin oxidoreductase C-terminal domain-containing protein [Deltaproteobacteria bacterium]
MGKFGTCSLNALSAESGDSPVKNWSGVGYKDFPLRASHKIGPESVIQFERKKYGCASCPLRCGGIMVTPEDWGIEGETHKPEYETCCAFSTLLVNNDLKSIFIINDMLNRAGMDTISCGGTVAFAASQQIGKGAEAYAVHCGGIEAPMHDPKFDPGFLASYGLVPAPGRHTVIAYQYLELQRLEKIFSKAPKIPMVTSRKSRFQYDSDKIEGLAVDAFFKMLIDCAGICLFGTQVGGQMPIIQWLNAATGRDLSPDDYLTIGERVFQFRHLFNTREGINPAKDFKPHPRICGDPPFKKGPARGVSLSYESLVKLFYERMNWDMKTGQARRGYLEKLGLGDMLALSNTGPLEYSRSALDRALTPNDAGEALCPGPKELCSMVTFPTPRENWRSDPYNLFMPIGQC